MKVIFQSVISTTNVTRHFHHRSKNCAASGLQKLRPFAAQTYKILGKNQITHGQSIFSRPIHAINPGLQMQLS
jgi:hypothetical protein